MLHLRLLGLISCLWSSRFVKSDRAEETGEILEGEAEIVELKARSPI
jgi:hypothetical protein